MTTKREWLKYKVSYYFLLPIFLFMIGFTVNSQEELGKRNPYILSKNSFSLGLTNAIHKTHFDLLQGESGLIGGYGVGHHLNFDYHFSIGNNWNANIGAGLGILPFSFKLNNDQGYYPGISGYSPNFIGRSKLSVGLSYHKWLNEKWGWRAGFNSGSFFMSPGSYSIGGSVFDANIEEESIMYGVNFETEQGPYGFLSLSGGFDRVLKNDNVLGFELGYTQGLRTPLAGEFVLYGLGGFESGTLFNRGSSLDFTLSYRFTRAKKMLAAEQLVYSDDMEFKEAKKEFKKKRREILPGANFFKASFGTMSARNSVKAKDVGLESGALPGWIFELDYQRELKKHKFLQVGWNISQYWTAIKHSNFGSSGGNAFIGNSFYAGFGYRLVSKKSNINFLNVSAGAALSFHTRPNAHNGSEGGSLATGNQLIYSYTANHFIIGNVFPTFYLNLSRDFQLTKALYFTLDYRLNLGFNTVHRTEADVYLPPNFDTYEEVNIDMNGTAHSFQFGLKLKLD